MAKLWLTDKAYPVWSYLIRIIYWLLALYFSSLYLQHFQQESWYKIGLMAISLVFVIVFLKLGRWLDHFFNVQSK